MFHDLEIQSYFSEINTSSFTIDSQKSSIEICLENIKGIDYFITILDRRYGPSLKNFGYGDISATELEYQTAKKLNIKLLFFIRDRTLSEYSLYKKNKSGLKCLWVEDNQSRQLFDFVDRHKKLQNKTDNNWYYTFSNIVDLKQTIKKYLDRPLLKEKLPQLIANNELPHLYLSSKILNVEGIAQCELTVKNVGKTAAFINNATWVKSNYDVTIKLLPPGESLIYPLTFPASLKPHEQEFILDYSSYDGITIKEIYKVKITPAATTRELQQYIILHCSIELKSKKIEINNPVDLSNFNCVIVNNSE
jgi:hypothetical protein